MGLSLRLMSLAHWPWTLQDGLSFHQLPWFEKTTQRDEGLIRLVVLRAQSLEVGYCFIQVSPLPTVDKLLISDNHLDMWRQFDHQDNLQAYG